MVMENACYSVYKAQQIKIRSFFIQLALRIGFNFIISGRNTIQSDMKTIYYQINGREGMKGFSLCANTE